MDKTVPGAVDLTFAPVLPRALIANVKSKTALENLYLLVSLGSGIRKQAPAT
jgi:hypothetical protein